MTSDGTLVESAAPLAAILVSGVEAKVNRELSPLADDLNVLLASNVASSDLQIDFATSGYLAPSGLLLDPNPSARADVTINTHVIAAGENPVATNSATVSITFDYARGTELSPSSDHNQRYALILWHGVEANDPVFDTRIGIRATMITSGIDIDPTLSAAQAQTDSPHSPPMQHANAQFRRADGLGNRLCEILPSPTISPAKDLVVQPSVLSALLYAI